MSYTLAWQNPFSYTPSSTVQTSAWLTSRFGSPPAQGDVTPAGSPDFGITNVAAVTNTYGNITVSATWETPDQSTYYILFVDTNDGQTPNVTYWSPLIEPRTHDSQQPYTSGGDMKASRKAARTTTASGSNNVALPTATINVASTAAFDSSGYLVVLTQLGWTSVQYTGVTSTTFTGCTGGTGTLITGLSIYQAYLNDANRRSTKLTFAAFVSAHFDAATIEPWSTIAGDLVRWGVVGVNSWGSGAGATTLNFQAVSDCDPGGVYAMAPNTNGSGSITVGSWFERDE